jgi:DNA-binding transcriptional MocR family regulator
MKKYEIVMQYIIQSTQSGSIHAGESLPSIRALSDTLGVSNITVSDAYCRLEQMGIVTSKERRGFLLNNAIDLTDSQNFDINANDVSVLSKLHIDHFQNAISADKLIKFGSILPSNSFFPNEQLSKYLLQAIREDPNSINCYEIPAFMSGVIGAVEKAITNYMFIITGTIASETEIICTNGATEGIRCALRASTDPGDLVVVENPGHIGVYNQLRYLNLEPLAIDVLPDGIDLDQLEQHLMSGLKPSCAVVTPNFQSPTGSLMSLENRKRFIALCEQYNLTIIEDDVMGALRFGKMLPTLKSLNPEEVIYVSSFSKALAPGYRVGWVAGGKYSSRLRTLHGLSSMAMMRAGQKAVAMYLQSGKIKTYLQSLRQLLEHNCQTMTEIIDASFPKGTHFLHPTGGHYLWVEMPEDISATNMYPEALERGIMIAPGNLFTWQKRFFNCMRFSFAMPMTPDVLDALAALGTLAKSK